MRSLHGAFISRGIPRIAGAARAGHGRGPYAARRIRRGVPRFAGAIQGTVCRMYPDGGIGPVGNTFMCSASTGPLTSDAPEWFRQAIVGAGPCPARQNRPAKRTGFRRKPVDFGTHKCVPYTACTSVAAHPDLRMRHGPGMATAPTRCGASVGAFPDLRAFSLQFSRKAQKKRCAGVRIACCRTFRGCCGGGRVCMVD